MEYGKIKKRYVIHGDDHTHAKLLLKLVDDKIKVSIFFKEVIRAYIEDNKTFREWIESTPKIQRSKRSMIKKKREERNEEKINRDFNLEQKEVDEIFDILAEEFGE